MRMRYSSMCKRVRLPLTRDSVYLHLICERLQLGIASFLDQFCVGLVFCFCESFIYLHILGVTFLDRRLTCGAE